MLEPPQEHRRFALWPYLVAGALLLLSSASALVQLWDEHVAVEQAAMRRIVNLTSLSVDQAVVSATKVLDMARNRIELGQKQGPLSPRQVHDILRSTCEQLTVPGSLVSEGLLFAADRNGTLYARNTTYPIPPLHVQDRWYFKTLHDDPQRRYSVGSLTLGRTDHRAVFHVAEPILDPQRHFAGVVMQQIPAVDLLHSLDTSLESHDGTLLVLIDDSRAAFSWPLPTDPDRISAAGIRAEYAKILTALDHHDWPKLSESAIVDHEDLAYVRSGSTGLMTVMIETRRQIFWGFVTSHWSFLLVVSVSLGVIFLMMALHLRQTSRLVSARHDSLHDRLTGLPNRRALDERFPLQWREALRRHESLSALFIDIDHFKAFNDNFGHVYADRALQQVAGAIQGCLRRPFDFACRWGGEEFVVLLPETGSEGAMQVAESVLRAVRALEIEVANGRKVHTSVSIGASSLRVTPEHFENDLVDLADKAMLVAKSEGRDRIHLA